MISGVSCTVFTLHYFLRDRRENNNKSGIVRGGKTNLIKMGDMRGIGKYKIPGVRMVGIRCGIFILSLL